ncbi:hypothetical protein [Oceanimonas doudoroffii]|uniref:hypothetical protein n=1 Tax=Oceanimonas doudoroffii TaxID=84158 RepID=UPI001140573A|nr:hypothetical protein [Oceanimonas doudoroffii]
MNSLIIAEMALIDTKTRFGAFFVFDVAEGRWKGPADGERRRPQSGSCLILKQGYKTLRVDIISLNCIGHYKVRDFLFTICEDPVTINRNSALPPPVFTR